jgi:5-methylcytosine-specific restriction endonuclease McrA
MPTPAHKRNYKKEYARDHASPTQRKHRSMRNKARRKLGLKKGDGKEVDHKKPLSKGGGNGRKNLKATSRAANRRKATKSPSKKRTSPRKR